MSCSVLGFYSKSSISPVLELLQEEGNHKRFCEVSNGRFNLSEKSWKSLQSDSVKYDLWIDRATEWMLVPARSKYTDVLELFDKLDSDTHSAFSRKNSQVARFSELKPCEWNIGREEGWSKPSSYTVWFIKYLSPWTMIIKLDIHFTPSFGSMKLTWGK